MSESTNNIIKKLREYAEYSGRDNQTLSQLVDSLRPFSSKDLAEGDIADFKSKLNAFVYSKNTDVNIPERVLKEFSLALDRALKTEHDKKVIPKVQSSPLVESRPENTQSIRKKKTGYSVPPLEPSAHAQEPISLEKTRQRRRIFLASLIVLLALASILALVKLFSVSSHQDFDSYDSAGYLDNGAIYAGFPGYGQAFTPSFPPVNSLFLALFFRISGHPALLDGYLVSAILYFVSMLACFLISKRIMSPLLAVVAAVSFGIAPSVFQWAGIMMTNVEAVAIGSGSIAVLMYAFTMSKKIFLIAIPLLALAVFTRFTAGVFVLVAIVFLLANLTYVRRFWKWILVGSILGLLTCVIVALPWLDYVVVHKISLSSMFPAPDLAYGSGNPSLDLLRDNDFSV